MFTRHLWNGWVNEWNSIPLGSPRNLKALGQKKNLTEFWTVSYLPHCLHLPRSSPVLYHQKPCLGWEAGKGQGHRCLLLGCYNSLATRHRILQAANFLFRLLLSQTEEVKDRPGLNTLLTYITALTPHSSSFTWRCFPRHGAKSSLVHLAVCWLLYNFIMNFKHLLK